MWTANHRDRRTGRPGQVIPNLLSDLADQILGASGRADLLASVIHMTALGASTTRVAQVLCCDASCQVVTRYPTGAELLGSSHQ